MSDPADAAEKRVAIVGGGLAGLAAAVGLADRGLRVELFETRRQLGGRATSYRDPASGALVDHCQHVSLGCCTNLADFYRRAGLGDLIWRYDTLHFFGPDARQYDLKASPWLPAPLHLLPALLRLNYLPLGERLAIIRAMRALARSSPVDDQAGLTIDKWLIAHGQTPRAIELFWAPVIVSALSETLDRAAVPPVRKVFVDSFMASRHAYEMEVPKVALGELYGPKLEQRLQEQGVQIRRECGVRQVYGDSREVAVLELASGDRQTFDAVVLAVPWRRVGELLSQSLSDALPQLRELDKIESAPISAVHLWFDRSITDLPHAVLPGRTSQWIFNHGPVAVGHYYQVVISASRNLAGRDRGEIIKEVCGELSSIWPIAREAVLNESRLVSEQHAVFSVQSGVERLRPAQQTAVPNVFLAGDWTATGWPSTMEGAVRSGYLAAAAVLRHFGRPARLLVPDLPRSWLSRLLV